MASSVIRSIITKAFVLATSRELTDLNIELGNYYDIRLYNYSYFAANKPSNNGGYMLTIGNNSQGYCVCFTYANEVTIYVRKITEGTSGQWTRISTTQ